jgi:hypothetical protein
MIKPVATFGTITDNAVVTIGEDVAIGCLPLIFGMHEPPYF